MINRKPYERRGTEFPAWTLKAIGLVIAGAATMIVAVTITKHVSIESDSPRSGKLAGTWHEAVTMPPTEGSSEDLSIPGEGPSPHTVVHNGMTVVTPELLVPVIDLASLDEVNGSDGKPSANKSSSARQRSRYAKRSQSRRQTNWKAYGLAIR